MDQGHYELAGFLDDSKPVGSEVFGRPVLGAIDAIGGPSMAVAHAVVAIGDNQTRGSAHERLAAHGARIVTVIHDAATVASSATLGEGTAVMAGAVVGTEAQLGQGVIVNAGATVDHHAVIEDFGHVGVGSALAGGSRVRERAWLRAGCVLGYRAVTEPGVIYPPGTVLGE